MLGFLHYCKKRHTDFWFSAQFCLHPVREHSGLFKVSAQINQNIHPLLVFPKASLWKTYFLVVPSQDICQNII